MSVYFYFDSRPSFTEFEQGTWNQTVDRGDADAEAKPAELTAGDGTCSFKGDVDVANEPSTAVVERRPGRSERNPAPVTDQKGPPIFSSRLLMRLLSAG